MTCTTETEKISTFSSDFLNSLSYPAETIVPGRVLHIDGDFVAYFVASKEGVDINGMLYNADEIIQSLKGNASADKVCIHLTDAKSTKGGRYDIAIQKPYQASRQNKAKPLLLDAVKKCFPVYYETRNWIDQEADDGLCQANWDAIQRGERELSVIVSKDKDLMQCQGLHMDWSTGEIFDVNGFGGIHLEGSKLVGTGTAFFWAQMLMGDAADGIQGLPFVHEDFSCTRKRTKCGPVTAYKLLEHACTNTEAYNIVYQLYMALDGEYKCWKSRWDMDWSDVMQSEAQLLWMRRTHSTNDVFNWWSE